MGTFFGAAVGTGTGAAVGGALGTVGGFLVGIFDKENKHQDAIGNLTTTANAPPDHSRMGKGVALTKEELGKLRDVLGGMNLQIWGTNDSNAAS